MFSTGAPDILKVFLEASAAKGEWIAALQSFNSVSSTKKRPCHTLLLCEAFAKGDRWERALSICQESLDTIGVPKSYVAKGYLYALESYVKNRLPPPSRTEPPSALPSSFSLSEEVQPRSKVIPFKKQELHWEEPAAIHMATIGWNSAMRCDSEQETMRCASSILRCCEEHIIPHLSPEHRFSESCEAWKSKLGELRNSCASSGESQSRASSFLRSTPLSSSPPPAVEVFLSPEASSSPYSSVVPTPTGKTSAAQEVPFNIRIAPQESPDAKESKELEKKLFRILHQTHIKNAWKSAFQVFFQMHRPGFPCFQALLECLSREGRVVEVENVILELYQFQKKAQHGITSEMLESRWLSVRLSRRLLQNIVECAIRLHSVKLCTLILSDRLLSSRLSPSSAVLLLSFFSRRPSSFASQELPVVRTWWKGEVREWNDGKGSSSGSCGRVGKGGEAQDHKKGYSLCTHLKVSSLVAKCIIRESSSSGKNAMWHEALECFQYSEMSNPDLALLFKLRILRAAKDWETALALFMCRLEGPSSPTRRAEQDTLLRDCSSIFTLDNPSKWIPKESLSLVQCEIEKRGLL